MKNKQTNKKKKQQQPTNKLFDSQEVGHGVTGVVFCLTIYLIRLGGSSGLQKPTAHGPLKPMFHSEKMKSLS